MKVYLQDANTIAADLFLSNRYSVGMTHLQRRASWYLLQDAATLLPIIQQWVQPGTTVHSDMWQAYNQLAASGYQHGTVNHTLHFVDPATAVTTNCVEAMWQRAKNKVKVQHGPTDRDMIPDYLAEFMWNQRLVITPSFTCGTKWQRTCVHCRQAPIITAFYSILNL